MARAASELEAALAAAKLPGGAEAAAAWCREQGLDEAQQVADAAGELGDHLGLKPLERKRLLRALSGGGGATVVSVRRRVDDAPPAGAPSRESSPEATVEATGAAAAAAGSALDVIGEPWRAEARRCWGPDGWIADMLPAGRDYSQSPEAAYILARPSGEQRPWRPSAEAGRKPVEPMREADCRRAQGFLGEAGSAGAVLDVGCGDAFYARRFASSGAFGEVYAFDISWPSLEQARELAEAEGFGPQDLLLAQADLLELPFGDGQLDAVMWGNGMHLIGDTINDDNNDYIDIDLDISINIIIHIKYS